MKILFATDGSEPAGGAVQFLAALPLPRGTAIHALTVADSLTSWDPEWVRASQEDQAMQLLKQAADALSREGVTVTPVIGGGQAAREILRVADEFDADLIVVGSHGFTGLAGFVLGSVARNVAHHARRPVLVARAPEPPLQRVVLAVDESEHAANAADFTASFPLPADAEILVTHVVRPLRRRPGAAHVSPEDCERLEHRLRHDRHSAAQELVERVAGPLRKRWHVIPLVREGDPAAQILALADETQANLVIAGARGVSLLEGMTVGSVADRLLKHADCSVLVVH